MECVLQGIIETQYVDALEVLLRGLCEGQREAVKIHEICLRNSLGSQLHLQCDLTQASPSWTVKLVGGPMRGSGAEQLTALVRNVVDCKISNNALHFFYAIGYNMEYELLRNGFSFCFQRGLPITVTVISVCKIPRLHRIDEATPVTPGIHLVEVTAPATADNFTEAVSAISSFSEYLAPLVNLAKPGVFGGVVPTAATAAAALSSRPDKVQ